MYLPRLRIMREQMNLTQAKVAALLGIDQRVYSTYETGKRDIPLRHLLALTNYYHVTLDYLMGRGEESDYAAAVKQTYCYPRLRDLREDHDMTQEMVGRLLGTTQQQYYKYEKGIQEIPAHHLITLADYYHVSVDYLLGRDTK